MSFHRVISSDNHIFEPAVVLTGSAEVSRFFEPADLWTSSAESGHFGNWVSASTAEERLESELIDTVDGVADISRRRRRRRR